MKSALIENGIVTSIIVGEMEGFKPIADNIECNIGWLFDGKDFTPLPLPEISLNQAKEEAKSAILSFANKISDRLQEGYAIAEIQSFPAKGPAARAQIEKRATTDQIALLKTEADRLGISVQALAEKIDPKATLFIRVAGEIAAFRQLAEAGVEKAKTPEALDKTLGDIKAKALAVVKELGIEDS